MRDQATPGAAPWGCRVTRTLAEARAEVTDEMQRLQAYSVGWARGFQAAADLLGVNTDDPVEVLPDGQVTIHDPLLDPIVDRIRCELAEARSYRTPARTPEQIRALTEWSWRPGSAQDAYARAGVIT